MEVPKMSIMIKIFSLAYVLVIVLATVLSIVWALSMILAPDWMKRKQPIKH